MAKTALRTALALILVGLLITGLILLPDLFHKPMSKDLTYKFALLNQTKIKLELATTPKEQALGLMNRENLPQDEGMLFVFTKPSIEKFWMANTLIPLDMIWMDENKKIIFIQENAKPCTEKLITKCPSYGPNIPAKYVLEINAGQSSKFGIKTGDTVEFE